MNKLQSSKLAMGHAVSTALETFPATSVPPVFATKHAALKTKIDAIKAAAVAQGEPTVGKTEDRRRVFDDMVAAMRPVASAVTSYAKANRLGDLGAKVHLAPSALRRRRATERIRFAQQVHDAAQGALLSLADYGVTAPMLANLQTKIEAAAAQVSATRDAIVVRKVATGELASAVGQFNALLRDELDPLVESLRDTHPTEHATYRAARLTINPIRSATATPAPVVVSTLASERASLAPMAEKAVAA